MTSQIVLFDQPRAGAHLLQRILSQQQSLQLLYNNLGSARGTQVGWLMKEDWAQGMSEETRKTFETQIHDAVNKWQSDLAEAKDKGKILMIQDHIFSAALPEVVLDVIEAAWEFPAMNSKGNFTLIPIVSSYTAWAQHRPDCCDRPHHISQFEESDMWQNDLLLKSGTVPILMIRDPRLTIPSTYRVLKDMGLPHGSGRPNFLISTSTLWQRMIYEFYIANGIEPVVVDADDLMTSPGFVRALVAKVDLEPDRVCQTWDPISDAARSEMHPSLYASQKYLLESSGVNASRATRNMDMEKEVAMWEKEFGEDVELLSEMLRLAEPGYRFMRERRFKA